MEQSDSIKELASALSVTQGELKNVAKSGKGNYGKYAELGPTLDEVRPIISKQGLAVVQMPVQLGDGTTGLTTQLTHKSGEWLRATFPVRMQQQTPQGQGSAITYARRYALSAVLGIAGDDDDGQAGSEGKNPEPRHKPQKAPIGAPKANIDSLASPQQKKMIQAQLERLGVEPTDMAGILSVDYGIDDTKTMTSEMAQKVIADLLKRSAS